MHTKRLVVIVSASLATLAALWCIGTLLIDVHLPGRGGHRSEAPVPSYSAGTLREVFESLPVEGGVDSRIELLDDNPEAWAARWRLLGEARENLTISYFILKQDIFGVSFLGHLLHKAHQGVRIRILLDAIGTKLSRELSGNDYLDTLVGTGKVAVKMYRPLFFRYIDAFLTMNPAAVIASDHDKILAADGRLALIGGRNIALEYFADPRDYPKSFRDADVLLGGLRIGSVLEAAFDAGFESGDAHDVRREAVDIRDSRADLLLAYEAMDAWLRGSPFSEKTIAEIRKKGFSWIDDLKKLPRLRGALKKKPARPIAAEVRLLDSRPRLLTSDDPISRSLVRLAQSARGEIFIQSPYLVLSRHVVSLFEQAAARGVRITVLTNSPVSSDNALSQAFFLEQWPEVMARVPTLRLFVTGDRHTLHGKLGAIDGHLALIGTYNMDPLSMAVNSELVAAVWSAPFARQLLAKPQRLIAGGPPRIYEYRIARDRYGRPKRDRDGNVAIAFGPEHHSSPEQWKAVQRYWKLLRQAEKLPGFSKLL
ncbi:MAG: phosphatidylserine/phosphatidylglycerophosphate/cardiolipin synthase family protein [Alphaproteobacteria bacterium]|uniref:Phosphatidylserine/phosphatidylglycerophosphate/ cardiolipin synthase family protein n=1 Tax=Candidatus Nitrobium versatile TaxID=2884831 RepID=A0A953M0Y8_9BACT|nr:phosphatidylserine/phosphatidylglycerophosphate/cardiolipin synthase family protein [Candidatus Nitrobium versatile]